MLRIMRRFIPICVVSVLTVISGFAQDSLPSSKGTPQSPEELWKGYDPTVEPLGVYIHSEWEEDGITFRALKYYIGTFNGKRHYMVAIYGFPTGKKGLPGLIHNHGGGGGAVVNLVKQWALNDYAVIDLNWSGNTIKNTDRQVIWEKPNKGGGYGIKIAATMRAVTFLQQQPEVAPKKIGLWGHSIGGRITFCSAAIDKRVVASSPSCMAGLWRTGPIRINPDVEMSDAMKRRSERTLGTRGYIPLITHPILIQAPAKDGVQPIERAQMAVELMPTKTYAFTHGPYKPHNSIREFFITPMLWFDHHLKGTFTVPSTPSVSIDVSGDKTFVSVFPDVSREVDSVIVHFYYHNPELHPRERRWGMGVKGVRANDNEWTFTLPAQIEDRQMWVFANVFYPLGKEMTGTNWAGKTMNTDRFGVSSDLKIIEANQSH